MQNEDETKARRWKNCSACIADNCNHECYVTYITGLYSLEWEVKAEKRSRRALCCCSWREQLFYPFLVIAFCMSMILLLVWIETSNEYNGFDCCDGVPFLMHDYDLRRTTNIGEIMPNASNTTSNLFYWDFLSTLNAGRWFVQSQLKPFYNMEPLSEADREKARNQKIPKLTDLLELAQKERKFVMFDLNNPEGKHPFRNTLIQQVVRVILDSKIEQHLIYWLPSNYRTYVKSKAPGFQQVGRLHPIEVLTRENINIINVDYKRLFHNGLRDYKAANITINLYLINEPWLFSLAWCSKIHSVTTDNIQLLRQIRVPHYLMTPGYYMFMWLLLDIVSTIFIVAIFYFHWWRASQKEKDLESTSSYADAESIHLERRKSEKGEAMTVSPEPPSQVRAGPQTPAAPSPDLTDSRKKDREPRPVQETTGPLMPTDDFIQQMPPEEAFKPTQAPTYEADTEATVQPAVPDSE